MSAAFLSAHALVALLVPVLMGVYKATCAANGVKQDRTLAIFLLLGLVFAANIGGPGSPAAGARNAIMVAYLADAGHPIGFGEWMKLGMPLVPVLALTVGAYMYIRCKPKLLVRNVNPSEAVNREVANLPKFGGKEAIMAAILGMLIATWVTLDDRLGLGGATLVAVSAMFLFSIISWRDVRRGVAFDVVGLYAAAGAIAVGLSFTSGGLWLATRILDMLPAFLSEGDGLVMGVSVLTVLLTNVMSDGATVGTLGPVVLPIADLGNASIWKVGLITSFASSFANVLVVGTPDNAIAFAMSKDPGTGRKLLSVFDFIKYGLPLTVLLMIVMWGWALFGYWSLHSWPWHEPAQPSARDEYHRRTAGRSPRRRTSTAEAPDCGLTCYAHRGRSPGVCPAASTTSGTSSKSRPGYICSRSLGYNRLAHFGQMPWLKSASECSWM